MTTPAPAPMTAEICAAPFPNECCATEEQCIGRASAFELCGSRPTVLRDIAFLRAVPNGPAAWCSVPNRVVLSVLAHIDALTARVAELERADRAEAELAAARKVEDAGIADVVGWLRDTAAGLFTPDAHYGAQLTKAADLLTRLSAALKEANDRADSEKDLREGSELAADELTTAWKRRAQATEAKLAALRKVFAPVFKDFGPEWPDAEGLEVVSSQPDDEEDDDGVGRCHFTLGQIRRALQTKDTTS